MSLSPCVGCWNGNMLKKKFFEICPVLEKPECGAGLDKWQYIWRTVGGRLNMFWSRPNSLVTKDPCYWYWSPVPYNAMHAKLRHVLWTNCYSHQTGSLLLCTRHEQCNVVQFFQPQWTTPKTETLVPLHNAPQCTTPPQKHLFHRTMHCYDATIYALGIAVALCHRCLQMDFLFRWVSRFPRSDKSHPDSTAQELGSPI